MRGSLRTSRILPLLIGVIAYAHTEYIDRALFTFLEKELNDAPVDPSADGKPITDDMPMATPPIATVFRGRSRRSIEPVPPRDLTKSIGLKKGHQMMEQEEKKDTLVKQPTVHRTAMKDPISSGTAHSLPVMGNQIPNQPAVPTVSPSPVTTLIPSGTPMSGPVGKENLIHNTPPPVLSVARNPLPSPLPQVPIVVKNPLPSRPPPPPPMITSSIPSPLPQIPTVVKSPLPSQPAPPPPSPSAVSNPIPSPPPPTTSMVGNRLPSQPALPKNLIPNGPLAMPSPTRNSIPSRPVSPPPLPPVINNPIPSQATVFPSVTRNPIAIQTAVPFQSQVLSTTPVQPIIPSRPVPLPTIPNQPTVASQPAVVALRPEWRSQFPGRPGVFQSVPGGATSTQVVRFPAGFNQGAVFSQLPRSQAVFPARNPIPNLIGVFRPAVWNQAPTQTVVFQRTFRPLARVVSVGPAQRQVIMDRPEWAPQARALMGGFRWGMVPNPTPLRVRQFSGPREWEFGWGGDSRWSAFNRDPRFYTDTRASFSQSTMPNSRMFLRNQFDPRQFVVQN
ncbi:hypothetical protein Q1695_011199 [Nippostrongylus brasiliensis]|nr:hypothetical protein Q1695_011199 [Nippostrongylus brasiliensis]